MFENILMQYGLHAANYTIEAIGSGLIHQTWKLSNTGNNEAFILQRINTNVFKQPEAVSENVAKIGAHLHQHFPGYLFVLPIASETGYLSQSNDQYYHLLPYIQSVTLTTVQTPLQAFEAARQFGRFTKLLDGMPVNDLNYTLPGFHDLSGRMKQFKRAIQNVSSVRKTVAQSAIGQVYAHENIADQYAQLVKEKAIPLRVIHHDTKISNVLFNEENKGLCVIDLDTVMPGYFMSDVGDMMRTYLSPVDEEEKDVSKIEMREDIFKAIVQGYFSEMGSLLTVREKQLVVYAGKYIIYMQGVRFLTDYLQNDVYYGERYQGHNLVRAENQFALLNKYMVVESRLEDIVEKTSQPGVVGWAVVEAISNILQFVGIKTPNSTPGYFVAHFYSAKPDEQR